MHLSYARVATVILAATIVSGCAALSTVQPGMQRTEVVERMGQPYRVLPLGNGARLLYSRQPAGQQVYQVDLDAGDRVVQIRQMLAAPEFQRIVVGTWTREDVEREFGPPASIEHAANWPTDILTYRWYDGQDMFYWVYVDAHNVVRRAEPGVEYHFDD